MDVIDLNKKYEIIHRNGGKHTITHMVFYYKIEGRNANMNEEALLQEDWTLRETKESIIRWRNVWVSLSTGEHFVDKTISFVSEEEAKAVGCQLNTLVATYSYNPYDELYKNKFNPEIGDKVYYVLDNEFHYRAIFHIQEVNGGCTEYTFRGFDEDDRTVTTWKNNTLSVFETLEELISYMKDNINE